MKHLYLMVVTDTLLVDTNIRVYVKAVSGNDNIISVSINKLLSDKGLIVVIPLYLQYSIENDCVSFTEIAQAGGGGGGTEHKLRRLRGLSKDSADDTLFDMINQ